MDHCNFKVPKEYIDPKKQEEMAKENKEEDADETKPKLYVPSGPDGKGSVGSYKQY